MHLCSSLLVQCTAYNNAWASTSTYLPSKHIRALDTHRVAAGLTRHHWCHGFYVYYSCLKSLFIVIMALHHAKSNCSTVHGMSCAVTAVRILPVLQRLSHAVSHSVMLTVDFAVLLCALGWCAHPVALISHVVLMPSSGLVLLHCLVSASTAESLDTLGVSPVSNQARYTASVSYTISSTFIAE